MTLHDKERKKEQKNKRKTLECDYFSDKEHNNVFFVVIGSCRYRRIYDMVEKEKRWAAQAKER